MTSKEVELEGDDPRVIEAAAFVEARSRELNRRLGSGVNSPADYRMP